MFQFQQKRQKERPLFSLLSTCTSVRVPCKEAGVIVLNLPRFRRDLIPGLSHVSSPRVTTLLRAATPCQSVAEFCRSFCGDEIHRFCIADGSLQPCCWLLSAKRGGKLRHSLGFSVSCCGALQSVLGFAFHYKSEANKLSVVQVLLVP